MKISKGQLRKYIREAIADMRDETTEFYRDAQGNRRMVPGAGWTTLAGHCCSRSGIGGPVGGHSKERARPDDAWQIDERTAGGDRTRHCLACHLQRIRER